ncbi:MAG TPA: hypothetical protein VK811_01645, partial [Candidatus Acidoferrum sp.]|nr:hypothetical protein [Candidatus Acidoferrum sp.]
SSLSAQAYRHGHACNTLYLKHLQKHVPFKFQPETHQKNAVFRAIYNVKKVSPQKDSLQCRFIN